MNKAEKMIGDLCYNNAKNKDAVAKYLGLYKQNRQERRLRDKAIDNKKEIAKEATLENNWN